MGEKHPNRKKDKYNPYTLIISDGRYYLSFKDSRGDLQTIEIDEILYGLFNRFEREDISYLNKLSRHIEHSELTEASLNDRAFCKPESIEEKVSRNIEYELLHKAISKLPEIQRRRLLLYFFGEMTYEQIAEMLEEDMEMISKIGDIAKNTEPPYDVDKVLEKLLADK